jgi:hypothetical protein
MRSGLGDMWKIIGTGGEGEILCVGLRVGSLGMGMEGCLLALC